MGACIKVKGFMICKLETVIIYYYLPHVQLSKVEEFECTILIPGRHTDQWTIGVQYFQTLIHETQEIRRRENFFLQQNNIFLQCKPTKCNKNTLQ